jgi:hypothetical protein
LNIAENYERISIIRELALGPTVSCVRWNSSWIDVEFARATAACFCPTGGTDTSVTDTLSGIHLYPHQRRFLKAKSDILHELIRVARLQVLHRDLHLNFNSSASQKAVENTDFNLRRKLANDQQAIQCND